MFNNLKKYNIMNEISSENKRIIEVILIVLLSAFLAWLICKGTITFFNSKHPLLAGAIIIVQTIIIYSLLNSIKNMGCKHLPFMKTTNRGGQNKSVPQEDNNKNLEELERKYKDEIDRLTKKHETEIKNLESSHADKIKEKEEEIQRLGGKIQQLEAEIAERYMPRNMLVDKLIKKIKPLQDDYIETRDDEQEQKEQIESELNHLTDRFRFVHYKDNEQYFELINSRKRTELDEGKDDLIETCPAVLFDGECILKGTYVLLT